MAYLSYVYNHHERDLAERLTVIQHQHHDLVVASTHVHLDHDNCLETVMLRGATKAVQQLSDALIAERGVRHGQLNLIGFMNHNFGTLGYFIIGIFILCWAASVLIYRMKRFDELEIIR